MTETLNGTAHYPLSSSQFPSFSAALLQESPELNVSDLWILAHKSVHCLLMLSAPLLSLSQLSSHSTSRGRWLPNLSLVVSGVPSAKRELLLPADAKCILRGEIAIVNLPCNVPWDDTGLYCTIEPHPRLFGSVWGLFVNLTLKYIFFDIYISETYHKAPQWRPLFLGITLLLSRRFCKMISDLLIDRY